MTWWYLTIIWLSCKAAAQLHQETALSYIHDLNMAIDRRELNKLGMPHCSSEDFATEPKRQLSRAVYPQNGHITRRTVALKRRSTGGNWRFWLHLIYTRGSHLRKPMILTLVNAERTSAVYHGPVRVRRRQSFFALGPSCLLIRSRTCENHSQRNFCERKRRCLKRTFFHCCIWKRAATKIYWLKLQNSHKILPGLSG